MESDKDKDKQQGKKVDKPKEKRLTRLSGSQIIFTHKDLETIQTKTRKKPELKKAKSESAICKPGTKEKAVKGASPVLRPAKLTLATGGSSSSNPPTLKKEEAVSERPLRDSSLEQADHQHIETELPLGHLSSLASGPSVGTHPLDSTQDLVFKTCENTLGLPLSDISQDLSLPSTEYLGEFQDNSILEAASNIVEDSCAFLERISEKTIEDSPEATPVGSPVSRQESDQLLLSSHLEAAAQKHLPGEGQISCALSKARSPEHRQLAKHSSCLQEVGDSSKSSAPIHSTPGLPPKETTGEQTPLSTFLRTCARAKTSKMTEEADHASAWLQHKFKVDFTKIPAEPRIALRNQCIKRNLAADKALNYIKTFHGRLKPLMDKIQNNEKLPKEQLLVEKEEAKTGRKLLEDLDIKTDQAVEILNTYETDVPQSKVIVKQLSKEVHDLRDNWLQEFSAFEKLNVESDRQEEQISSAQSKLPSTSLKPPFDGTPRHYPIWRERAETIILSKPNLAETLKMQYIMDALCGKAKDSVAHFNILPGELPKLMNHLDSRFGDKQRLRQLFGHDLLAMPPLDNSASVSKVRDHVDRLAISARLAMKYGFNIGTSVVQDILVTRLPTWYRRELARKHTSPTPMTYDQFMTYMEDILDQEEKLNPYQKGPVRDQTSVNPVQGAKPKKGKPQKSATGTNQNVANINALSKLGNAEKILPQTGTKQTWQQKPKLQPKGKFQPRNTTPAKKLICIFCKSSHEEGDCPEFQSKPIESRRALASKHKICYSCLRATCPGRTKCDRKNRKCFAVMPDNSICTKQHHTLLHMNFSHDE